ncbi:MAG: UbiX family flavin prenyltransferase [Candidatus Caldarchaeales archaeon]
MHSTKRVNRIAIGVTGASGVIYAKRLLEVLNTKDVEVHLVISKTAEKIIEYELNVGRDYLEKLARYSYSEDDIDAPLASGSFKMDGMVIVPCSVKTVAGIVSGYTDNLILRAADVALKEKRKLILVPRETPLNVIHLRNMLELAKLGVIILPAMPAFYHKPEKIEELVDFIVGKILDILGIEHELFRRWGGETYK